MGFPFLERAPAHPTLMGKMHLDMVRLCYLAQSAPFMPGLSTALALFPLGHRRLAPGLFAVPIAAGWFVAVAVVLGQAAAQFGVLGFQARVLRDQMGIFRLETGYLPA